MSKIKVDQLEGSTGSTITIPTGQTLTVTDGIASSNLPTIPVSKGGTGLTSLGTAGQVVAVNSGANALEFADAGAGKILGTSYISYTTRFQPPASPASSNTGYAGTTNIFPANTFQYTKTIQNSHLQGWLVISGTGGGTNQLGGTISFSTDGSTLTNLQVVGTATNNGTKPNHTNAVFKLADNASAGTITIDPRYGGNSFRFWSIVNPNAFDEASFTTGTGSYMFIMEVAN